MLAMQKQKRLHQHARSKKERVLLSRVCCCGAPASQGAATRQSLTEQSRAPVANTRPQGAHAQPHATRACARMTRPANLNGASAPAGPEEASHLHG